MEGQPFDVTRVVISPPRINDDPNLICYACVVIDDWLRISGMRLVQSHGRARIFFPYVVKQDYDGRPVRKEHTHPLNNVARVKIEMKVIRAYREWLAADLSSSNDEVSFNNLEVLNVS